MHDYSIDRHPKEKILFMLAYLAIFIAPIANNLINQAVERFQTMMGWAYHFITAVPVFGLFWVIYTLFDHHFWKWRWLRKFLLVPDLNGKWICTGQTTLKDGNQVSINWNGEITIIQSWSKILVYLHTGASESKSISASIFHEVGVGYKFLYQYNNNPTAKQLDLNKHSGTTELNFLEDCSRADGYYFTDQHRRTVGTLNLQRK